MLPSAAKAETDSGAFTVSLKRYADTNREFSANCKARVCLAEYGTAEAVPFPFSTRELPFSILALPVVESCLRFSQCQVRTGSARHSEEIDTQKYEQRASHGEF